MAPVYFNARDRRFPRSSPLFDRNRNSSQAFGRRRSHSPIRGGRLHKGFFGDRFAYGDSIEPRRFARRRSPSPIAYRHRLNSPPRSYSSFRSRGGPPQRARAPIRRGRPPFPAARFSTRGRPPRIAYHCRPDISPIRVQDDSATRPSSREHSPMAANAERRSPCPELASSSAKNRRSFSPPPVWNRGRGFRGGGRASHLAGRSSRRSDFIGNFGQPVYHQPDYDVSPDRTKDVEASNGQQEEEEVAEDRDEIFTKMLEAKRSEKLDEYYRFRDLLNAFDKRNPDLAFRGSGRIYAKRRHSSHYSEKGGEKKSERVDANNGEEGGGEKKKKKTKEEKKKKISVKEEGIEELRTAAIEELEEVDSAEMMHDPEEQHGDEQEEEFAHEEEEDMDELHYEKEEGGNEEVKLEEEEEEI